MESALVTLSQCFLKLLNKRCPISECDIMMQYPDIQESLFFVFFSLSTRQLRETTFNIPFSRDSLFSSSTLLIKPHFPKKASIIFFCTDRDCCTYVGVGLVTLCSLTLMEHHNSTVTFRRLLSLN